MTINSPETTVNKSTQEVFNFLSDVENYKKLMPENTSKFEVLSEDSFVFALKGMPEIVLKIKETQPNNKVVLGAATDKLPFTLTGNISEVDAQTSSVNLVFEGNFNPMMAMMIKGPITNFIKTLAENLAKQ